MIALQDHIDELRAELRGCWTVASAARLRPSSKRPSWHSRSRAAPPKPAGHQDEGGGNPRDAWSENSAPNFAPHKERTRVRIFCCERYGAIWQVI
jgi:hypothetical protein